MRHDPTPPDQPDHHTGGGSSHVDQRSSDVVLSAAAAAYHQQMRATLAAFLAATSAGDVPGLTGLTPGVVLELDHRLPTPVVRQMEAIAGMWDRLPDTVAVYSAGLIEVADLGLVVRACRDLSPRAVAELDTWAANRAAHLHGNGLLHLLEADVLDRAVQLRAPGWASRQERRESSRTDRVHVQQDFDGGGLLVGDLTPVAFTTVVATSETVAGPPAADATRAEQRGAALVAVAEHALAGVPTGTQVLDHAIDADTAGGTALVHGDPSDAAWPEPGRMRIPTRPRLRITLVVDLAQATSDRFAQLQAVSGLRSTPTLSARLVETLAAEAQLLVQLAAGKRPLAELRATDIPEQVRRAVVTRDRGCRAPGCHQPPSRCDIHHIIARTDPRLGDAVHDPDNLVLLCRRHHRQLDTVPWTIRLHPTSASVTWQLAGSSRVRRTVPHGTRPLPRHPDGVPLAGWQAPPVPPPPPHPPPDLDSIGAVRPPD